MAAGKDPLVRLEHIQDEIGALTNARNGVTCEVFSNDHVLRRLVVEKMIADISHGLG